MWGTDRSCNNPLSQCEVWEEDLCGSLNVPESDASGHISPPFMLNLTLLWDVQNERGTRSPFADKEIQLLFLSILKTPRHRWWTCGCGDNSEAIYSVGPAIEFYANEFHLKSEMLRMLGCSWWETYLCEDSVTNTLAS